MPPFFFLTAAIIAITYTGLSTLPNGMSGQNRTSTFLKFTTEEQINE